MKEWLIQVSVFIPAIIVYFILRTYYKRRGGTPYEKKLRKQWEQEQRENQEFRKNIKVDQGYESWKKEKETQEQ